VAPFEKEAPLQLGMKTDRIRTDIIDIIFVFIFLVGRIRIRIMSTMSDKIGLDVDIINIRFKYLDTDTVSDVEYSDSEMDRSEPL